MIGNALLNEIQGLHHVTSMASDPNRNNQFFTKILGLRRVKKTVNFDRPDVYHLYYGDEHGTPGSVMTYFPFLGLQEGRSGIGEVGTTAFAVPKGSLEYWEKRLDEANCSDIKREMLFGQERLQISGPDNDEFALVEVEDARLPWKGSDVPDDVAIQGFHSVSIRVADHGAMRELLGFMNYEVIDEYDGVLRMGIHNGNSANVVDLVMAPSANSAEQGAGSVHHVAFSVKNRAAQLKVREALLDTGYAVTPVIDRDYFWAIYFRTPEGILFEIATDEPGFARDEEPANLGTELRLPAQHEHLREKLETSLEPIKD